MKGRSGGLKVSTLEAGSLKLFDKNTFVCLYNSYLDKAWPRKCSDNSGLGFPSRIILLCSKHNFGLCHNERYPN